MKEIRTNGKMLSTTRSNHWRCSIKKIVLKDFAKIQACNFIKKETLAQVFSSEFGDIFKNVFFKGAL